MNRKAAQLGLISLALAMIPAASGADCLDCHETTACTTPAKPQGACEDCHLGGGDVNDYQSNFVTAVIDGSQWQSSGHGRAGIDMVCDYCHTYQLRHGDPSNPFRLRNTTGLGPAAQNGNCLACHGSGSAGVAPELAPELALINSTLKIDSYHAGARHNGPGDGGRFCWDCHDPHGDDNIAMIHNEISRQNDGEYGIPVETAAVVFTDNLTGTDYAVSSPPFNKICQVCHTETNHYTNSAGDGHNEISCCVDCHNHNGDYGNTAFEPKGCDGCHGYPPVIDAPQAIDGLVVYPSATGAASSGAHALHATASGYGYSCRTCHFDGMPDTPVSGNNKIQMGFDAFGFNGSDSVYHGQNLNSPYSYEGTNGTLISTSGPATTCANIYCHSDGTAVATRFTDPAVFPGPDKSSPAWDGSTSCASCHSYPPNYAFDEPKSNKHELHVDSLGYTCNTCHYQTTTNGSEISNRANHVNAQYDVFPDPGLLLQFGAQTINVDVTYTFDPGGGTCADISCHNAVGTTSTLPWGYAFIDAGCSCSPGASCGEIHFMVTGVTSSTITPTPPYTYFIDWESDGSWDYEGQENSHTHIYAETGEQTITWSVRDAKGHTLAGDGAKTSTVTPSTVNAMPQVAVSASIVGLTVTLTDQSLDPDYNTCGHSGDGRAMIDWGPGGYVTYALPLTDSPSGRQFSYTYSSPGTYTIRYGVYDNVITYPVFLAPNLSVTVPQN